MEEILRKLQELLSDIDGVLRSGDYRIDALSEARNKLKLYIKRFFKNNSDYKELVDEIDINVIDFGSFSNSMGQLRSVIASIMEDLKMSDSDQLLIMTEQERQEILFKARQEAELEKQKIVNEANEIQALKEDLQRRTENLLIEEEKFNSFKTKLEFADKGLDFQTDAKVNKTIATLWGVIFFLLLGVLIYIVCDNISSELTFSSIANNVKKNMTLKSQTNIDHELLNNTIYITYAKHIFSKLLLYSMIIFGIKFSVKNYNAQMHNYVVNSHKSNSLKSTISLLNTARSEDGNDKLLVQASQAIFSHQNSGYNNRESDSSNPNLITNVIDNVTKK